jgi:hypothetical protein
MGILEFIFISGVISVNTPFSNYDVINMAGKELMALL